MALVRTAAIALGWSVAAACGDNIPGPGPDLAPADTLIVIAHFDDDMIFMQPELLDALAAGSVTTVYVTSGDPVKGDDHADATFAAARTAYSAVLGASDWDCGYVPVAGAPAHHCRLGAVSLIALDIPDGGIEGTGTDSLLHLVEGDVRAVPILGHVGGSATVDSLTGELAELIAVTQPSQIHALDVGATHGRDHSSHLMSSSFALWGAARIGYAGAIRWHRGYNVATEAITLDGDAFTEPARMLSYFEACYFDFAPCGSPAPKLDMAEQAWMQRQYSFDRVTSATLESGLVVEPNGHLAAGELCAASTPDGGVELDPCARVPEQYWWLDSEGHVWNGLPPDPTAGMDYDHVRCLASATSAPTCGAGGAPIWSFR